jgi:hypothetical protein
MRLVMQIVRPGLSTPFWPPLMPASCDELMIGYSLPGRPAEYGHDG